MDYEAILAKIQQDENNDIRTDIYRYNGILEAISFFANRLTYEQITNTAFDFVNELLTVDKSALYLLSHNEYKKVKSRNMPDTPDMIPVTPVFTDFALYVGNVVSGRENLETYFTPDFLDKTHATVMIPMILEHKLTGFILMTGRVSAEFNHNDITVSETLMNLFNNALDGNNRVEKLQAANRELDEKIFNLFAINQSAKAMLTEHRLDELNHLAVDVFSELTLSANTSFFLYENESEKYALKAYRDVFHSGFTTPVVYLTLRSGAQADVAKQIVAVDDENDIGYFSALFEEGIDPLAALKAKYVVFIFGKGSELLGFVTLGETVSGTNYKKSTFELVDSLASYTYIALTNAMLIKVVNDQRKLLELKLDRLVTLNKLIKNINSAQTSTQLMELAMKTLTVSLGVESCMICLYQPEDNRFSVSTASDISFNNSVIPVTERLKPLLQGKVIFESDATLVSDYIGREVGDALGNKAGLLIIPMFLEHYKIRLIGAIFIFKARNSLLSAEENALTFETVANHMAPLIDGFISLEKRKEEYIPDVLKLFTTEVKAQIQECLQYQFDLEIVRMVNKNATPFTEDKLSSLVSDHFQSAYPVSYDQIYVVIHNDFDYNRKLLESLFPESEVSITCFRLNKNFHSYEELIELLR